MTRRTLSFSLALGLLVTILLVAVAVNLTKPRVLILHSYHPDYAWTRDIDVGLKRVTDGWSRYAVRWHYMDTKKHRDPEWLRRAGIVARRAIDQFDPDVLIAIDDLAQELAASHYVNRERPQIVFAGVNGDIAPYGYKGASNVTGIVEHKQLAAVRDTIVDLEQRREHPKAHPRVLYMLDPSASLVRDRGFFDGFDWAPLDYRGSVMAEHLEHWKRTVEDPGNQFDYLLIANYRKLPLSAGNEKLADPHAVAGWTEQHSPVPVVGVNAFNVEDGGSISVGVSPYEQGETAAGMAERILEEGIAAAEIPIALNRHYVIAINAPALARRGLKVPSVYEAFARATANYRE